MKTKNLQASVLKTLLCYRGHSHAVGHDFLQHTKKREKNTFDIHIYIHV